MVKKSSLAILCVIMAIACSAEARHEDLRHGFSAVPPDGWQIHKPQPVRNPVAFFYGPEENGLQVYISVEMSEGYIPRNKVELEKYAGTRMAALKSVFPSYEFISQTIFTHHGYHVFEWFGEAESEGRMLGLLENMLFDDGRVYRLTLVAPANKIERYRPHLEQVMASFKTFTPNPTTRKTWVIGVAVAAVAAVCSAGGIILLVKLLRAGKEKKKKKEEEEEAIEVVGDIDFTPAGDELDGGGGASV